MKAGLVAAIVAVAAVRRAGVPLRGDLLLACVPGEEDGGLGTYATLRRGWRADACVIPEPTSLQLVPANSGALTFRLTVTGRATHASRRTEGVSALEKLLPVLAALDRLEARRNVDVDPLMRRWPIAYPLSIGTVTAGDWASTVPDLLVAEGRLGVALDEPVEEARRALEEAVAEACADDPWLREHPAEVTWWGGQFASGRLPADSDLLPRLHRANTAAGGGDQETWGGPYGSDLRLLTAAGIPTVQYGPGESALAHAADERVPVEEMLHCARTLALLALDICGPV
jgi:acetylornithine deacetylase